MKTCTTCLRELPLDSFHRKGKYVRAKCKECRSVTRRARYAADPEAELVKTRAYQAANRDKYRQWNRANYIKNREEERAKRRAYGASHRAETRARHAAWYQKNKERVAAKRRARQAKELNAVITGVTVNASAIAARWEFYGGRCYMCGEPAEETDHVIPLSGGGPHVPANLRPSCLRCNRSKGADRDWRSYVA